MIEKRMDVAVTDLENSNSLVSYLRIVSRRNKLIILVTVLAAVVSSCITLILPNIYTAKTMILPPEEDRSMTNALMAQFGGLVAMAGGGVGTPSTGELYVTMLNSETVKDPIIDRFKLMNVFGVKYRTDAYRTLTQATSVSLGRKDGVISLSVSSKSPKRAAELANAYVEELGRLVATLNVTGAGKSRAYLEPRLADAKASLARAEDALRNFQIKNKTIEVPQQAEAAIRGVAEIRTALVMKEVELSTALRTKTESNQEVKNLRAAIANLRAQISSVESGKVGGAIPQLGSVPQLGQEYARLMREFKIQETMVELLTKQYEMTRLNEAKDYSPFQVLQIAKTPEKKSKPQRLRIVSLVTVSTFLIMLFYVFISDYWDRKSETEKAQWREIMKEWAFLRLGR